MSTDEFQGVLLMLALLPFMGGCAALAIIEAIDERKDK